MTVVNGLFETLVSKTSILDVKKVLNPLRGASVSRF